MERRQNLKEFNINKMFRIFSIFSSIKKKKVINDHKWKFFL